MALATTSATVAEMIAFYTDAELRVLKGQRVRFGDREWTRADLGEIRAGRQEWERKLQLQRNARRASYATADFGGVT